MNILFLTKSFGMGGVEVVTLTLAKAFKERGHNVGIFVFFLDSEILRKQVPYDINFYVAHGYKESRENVEMLHHILVEQNTDVIINQWGLPWLPIRVIEKARRGLNVKVVSVYHNQVDMNGRLMSCDKAINSCSNVILKSVLRTRRWAVKFITSRSMRYVYNHSDIYEVLSPSFIEIFKDFTGIKNPDHLVAQTNPVTIVQTNDFVLGANKKQKEIIYVGRLDLIQKRVHRVIDTWNYLEEQFPNWQLTIVGDGKDRQNLVNHVKSLGLQHIRFEGYKQPLAYYKRASLLILTSDFEGFPLVLAECMSFGVVPAVYDSYAAVRDIIENGKDGVIIPFNDNGYDAYMAAQQIADIMNNNVQLESMSLNAIAKSKKFSVERIYDEWKNLFDRLGVKP